MCCNSFDKSEGQLSMLDDHHEFICNDCIEYCNAFVAPK